jgi:aspartate dehydrogenase
VRVGLIGLGAIGGTVAQLARAERDPAIEIVAALVRDGARVRGPDLPRTVTTLGALLAERPEVVVEAAGHEALAFYGETVLRAGVDLLVVSVGALASHDLLDDLLAATRRSGARVILATGAIGGLDALAAAAVGGLTRVTHTTRKPARTLLSAADAARLTEPREIFRGTAREAALAYPENLNVTAAVAFSGLGLDRTEVRLVADPRATRNEHEVTAEGAFGSLRFAISNVPSDENPRTGRIVAMSVIHALRRRRSQVVFG